MDTRTGELVVQDIFDQMPKKRKKHFIQVNRTLTKTEKTTMKIGRNSLCGCNSGKKFKNCCWTGRYDSIQDDSHAEEMIQDQLDKY